MGAVTRMTEPTRATGCLPTVQDEAWLPVEDPAAVGAVRRRVSALAQRLGFPPSRVAEIGIVATELATNLCKHAVRGVVLLRSVQADQPLVELLAVDSGPGMIDPETCLRDGQSTTGTLGIGLGAVTRLADSFAVLSEVGLGTGFATRFHATRHPVDPGTTAAGLTRALAHEPVCGDAYAVRQDGDQLTLMLCDGSGHGPMAATASQRAVAVFCEGDPCAPEVAVQRIHTALVGTRGGAVSVARIDQAAGTVRFAGIGNVVGSVLSEQGRRGMVSLPGIAGYQARTFRGFDYEAPPGSLVVLHSDGLTDRWSVDGRERLLAAPPLLVAGALLREAGVRRDDACVLVARVGQP
ncbi:hypothetical protein KALB_4576 [Kutzneria albida DSM 43870]|uniref:PPM-type phosphatase domain-containing protein n=2 Tax=Kutzneria TaxID=43356 RepID=W5W9Y2_9PSEU|nr:hypothetical protein KALB_4576 [Kutzneria albida DSM 43870]